MEQVGCLSPWIPCPPPLGATARARLWSWRQGSVTGQIQTVFPPCSAGDGRASLGQAVSFFLRVCTSASVTSMLLEHLWWDFSRWDFSTYSLPLLQVNFTPSYTRGLLQRVAG